jgi:hypothetical protein
MQYKGYKYQVVQTSDPTKWQWTVDLGDGSTMTGSGYSRTAAIGFAQKCIDRCIDTANVTLVSSQQARRSNKLAPAHECCSATGFESGR